MKTLEFEAEVSTEGTLKIPSDVAEQLGAHQPVHVILLADDGDDADWNRLTTEQFFQGYAAGDEVYDDL
jgi:hypothetical protein